MPTANKKSLTITVFGSGAARQDSEEFREAARLGQGLAQRGFALCNGGYGSTMLAAARAARQAGAKTIGVTLSGGRWPAANPWIAREISCDTLLERITTLLRTGDGYAVLPGGTGTLAEVGLMLELMNKRLLPLKPAVFLGPFWMPLLELLKRAAILRGQAPYTPVAGVKLMGKVACADCADAAAAFLAANLAPSDR